MKKRDYKNISILFVIILSIIVIGITVFLTIRNNNELTAILEESIKSELISTSIAARELIDADRFDIYNSRAAIDADIEEYGRTLSSLRSLQEMVGATYIYALKQIDSEYRFIFDTDLDLDPAQPYFDEYEDIADVHLRAFEGYESAGIMNVVDQWGNFNTGAVPIFKGGKVIGVISTDIEDTYFHESAAASQRNAITLTITLIVTMGIMIAIVTLLLRNARKLQDKLFRMANYDVLTGLPNRQYMMAYLEDMAEKALKHGDPFAFLLMDLDNFKQVNDGAGHDAGDELLRHFGTYLNGIQGNSKAFRPPAGALNVSARIGGDEFVQIVPGVKTEDDAQLVAQKIVDGFRTQVPSRFIEKYQVGISIGVSLFPYHTENCNVLIKYADIAMYHAKKSGKNNYSVYNDGMMQEDIEGRADSQTDRRQYRRQ